MNKKVLESIIEITSKTDSDEFGISIVATVGELIANSIVCLFYKPDDHFPGYQLTTSLNSQQDEQGITKFVWDGDVPEETLLYIDNHQDKIYKLTVYETQDGYYHVFIPIQINSSVRYAIDIASKTRFSQQLDAIRAITKVCENFYTILSNSERDSLTGLFNRRTYDSKVYGLLKRQRLNQRPREDLATEKRQFPNEVNTWLAVIDIDFFKKVNDQFGHVYGDEVLLVLSQMMSRSFRCNDLLFRYGGEEFVIIFEPTKREHAQHLLEKFRYAVELQQFPMVGKITISIGYAQLLKSDHPKSVFDNADKALYFAKENGRNCVHNFEDLVAMGLVNNTMREGDIELF